MKRINFLKSLAVVLLWNLVSFTCVAQMIHFKTDHLNVTCETETEAYAKASAQVLEVARQIAVKNGFDLPDMLNFTVVKSDRNALWFDRKGKRSITWEYTTLSNFLPPNQSRKKNIYGLCHEIGHLCMYRTFTRKTNWMSADYRETWADFFGNFVVDSVFSRLGAEVWPEPHNYLESSGMTFLTHRITNDNPNLVHFNKASAFWCELARKIGFENIPSFFNAIAEQKVGKPHAREKYLEVLTRFIQNEDPSPWFNQYAAYLILD